MVAEPRAFVVDSPVCGLDGVTFVLRSVEVWPGKLIVHFWLTLDEAARRADARFAMELAAWRAQADFSGPTPGAPRSPPTRLLDAIVQVVDDRETRYAPARATVDGFDGGEWEGTSTLRGYVPPDAQWLEVQVLDEESEVLGRSRVGLR